MKVVFSPYFYPVYTHDPAAVAGRMEAICAALPSRAVLIDAEEATEAQIAAAHSMDHIRSVQQEGLYEIAALAAGGAIQAARTAMDEPAFAAVRPPGHHASADSCWGFCYFNNMAIAMLAMKNDGCINSAAIVDFDLHYGDGTADILGGRSWVALCNPAGHDRDRYLREVQHFLDTHPANMIGISAGFDNHCQDWGGLLLTEDYHTMGQMVARAARRNGGGCFAVLEGGYNHRVLGLNAAALLEGLAG